MIITSSYKRCIIPIHVFTIIGRNVGAIKNTVVILKVKMEISSLAFGMCKNCLKQPGDIIQ